tara:strand:- start:167 stop:538 length:372 start_codon:yes stop_codon:yes gene_type:complete
MTVILTLFDNKKRVAHIISSRVTGDNVMFLEKRRGEQGSLPIRSSRYFAIGSQWFFVTREKTSLGPFESFDQAETSVRAYIDDFDAQRRGNSVNYAYGVALHDYETCVARHCQQCKEAARLLS